METRTLSEAVAAYLQETPVPFVCAYLFGSYARGEQRPDSDVDIAVLLPSDAAPALTGPLTLLRGDLERLLRRNVDLVDLRRAPVDLVHRVLRDGRLLAERDPAERVRFEVRARNEYFDLLPHLLRYRRQGGRAA
jgi:uncharacterized protein